MNTLRTTYDMGLTQYKNHIWFRGKIISDSMVGFIESYMIFILCGTHIIYGSKGCLFISLFSYEPTPIYIQGWDLMRMRVTVIRSKQSINTPPYTIFYIQLSLLSSFYQHVKVREIDFKMKWMQLKVLKVVERT